MSNFQLVDPAGWEWDLHSIYSAYMGFFDSRNIAWWDKSWGALFATFEDFLSFGWPCVVVTDTWSNRAHIVTRASNLTAFLKMIKTRYGENLPTVDNIMQVSPFETQTRPLRTITDLASYAKLHHTLPAAVLSALKIRVRSGEPPAIQELWAKKEYTFLAIDFEWSERNKSVCLEFGFAALRCGFLKHALDIWPPVPGDNYRKGHYIVSDHLNQHHLHKKHTPCVPWEYAWGESQVISKTQLTSAINSLLSSLASPESDSAPNDLILVAHGISGDLERLNEMKIKLPKNVLLLDTSVFERQLFNTGLRGVQKDANGNVRQQGSTLSLGNVFQSHGFPPPSTLHNAGNDAFMCLLALQLLLEPDGLVIPVPTPRPGRARNQEPLRVEAFGLHVVGPANPGNNRNVRQSSNPIEGFSNLKVGR